MWTTKFDPDPDSQMKGNLHALWNIGQSDEFKFSRRVEDITDTTDIVGFKNECLEAFNNRKIALAEHEDLVQGVKDFLNTNVKADDLVEEKIKEIEANDTI